MTLISGNAAVEYSRPSATPTITTSLPVRVEVASISSGVVAVDFHGSLDPDNVAEVNTVTLTAGATDDIYFISATDDVNTTVFDAIVIQRESESASALATRLATLINYAPHVRASASNNVITVTGEIAGRNVTLSNAKSTDTSKIVIAQTTAPSGTPKEKRLARVEVQLSVNETGLYEAKGKTTLYDTNGTTVLNPSASYARIGTISAKTLDDFQTANGVARE